MPIRALTDDQKNAMIEWVKSDGWGRGLADLLVRTERTNSPYDQFIDELRKTSKAMRELAKTMEDRDKGAGL